MKATKKSAVFLKDYIFIGASSVQICLKRHHRCIGVGELTHSETIICVHMLCSDTGALARLGCRRNERPLGLGLEAQPL